jgi:hypothetical protein
MGGLALCDHFLAESWSGQGGLDRVGGRRWRAVLGRWVGLAVLLGLEAAAIASPHAPQCCLRQGFDRGDERVEADAEWFEPELLAALAAGRRQDGARAGTVRPKPEKRDLVRPAPPPLRGLRPGPG